MDFSPRLYTIVGMVLFLQSCHLYVRVESANVLLFGWYGDGSHFLSLVPIGNGLVQRGHNVTFLVADAFAERALDPVYSKLFHFEIYHYPGLKESMKDMLNRLGDIGFAEPGNNQMSQVMEVLGVISQNACEAVFSDHALLDRLREFDAFVVDFAWMCGAYVQSHLERHMGAKNIKTMVLVPMVPMPYILQQAGSPFIPSYQPVTLTQLSSSMSFFQRLKNIVAYFSMNAMCRNQLIAGPYKHLVDKYDLDPSLKYTFSNHIDLYFLNSDFSVEFPFALMPNVIPVGGLTAGPSKSLDKDLEDFMQSSGDHGVVVFSLGSYFASITSTRPEIVQMFVEAFRRIPQKVILHLKELPPNDLPDNLIALPWLPLSDLLGHPKTCAFLYHGGNNGFLEAVYHGVPIVVMPLATDQVDVAVRIEASGLGRKIDKMRISSDYIHEQLVEVLDNPKYLATAQRLSAIFRDRPMSPSDTAAFWIEHVIKHGADHLRPATLELSFFQIYMLDVVAFVLLCFAFICYALLCLLRYCLCAKKSPRVKRE